MKGYFKLSLKKLIKASCVCFAIFYTILIALMVVIMISVDKSNNLLEWTIGLLQAGAMAASLSIFIMILAFFTEYYEHRKQRRLFRATPFSRLHEKGFRRVELFKNSIWKLYQEVEAAQLNGFNVVASMHTVNRVSFSILTSKDASTKFILPDEFRESELLRTSLGMVLTIPANSFWTPSVDRIADLLQSLTKEMATRGFQPATDFKPYESQLKNDMIMKGLSMGS